MIKKKMQETEGTNINDSGKMTVNKDDKEQNEAKETLAGEALQGEASAETAKNETGALSDTDKAMDQLRASEVKVAELQDKYVRLSAEFDNYRKRTLREKMDLVKYADENLIVRILPFMDDFDRALANMDTTDCAAVKTGVELIHSKFSEFLRQNGVREIDAVNGEFNVDLHEAVARLSVSDDKKGKVVDVVQKGYFLQDKVIRFSKVVVGE